jgi:hypothetical protein
MKHGLIFDTLWHIGDRLSVMGLNDVRWYADMNCDGIGGL